MIYMGTAGDWRGGWAERGRRIAAARRALALTGLLLGLLAVAELIARLTVTEMVTRAPIAGPRMYILRIGSTGLGWQSVLVLCLLTLATTLPLAFLRPAAAAVTISAASALSLAIFGILTVAGLGSQLIAAYRLGRSGSQLLAVVLAVPFLVLALAGPAGSEVRVLTVLCASLVPAAAGAGTASRARNEAVAHGAARQHVAGALLENTARGERARITRELHDVVAHHISMVAVQAETARLATAGMPVAGAQRLLAIGDTARAALTEMRRLLGVLREDTETGIADRRPQPGLRQLNELLDEARNASGVGIRLIVSGPVTVLDPGVELAAYRIVQEALTNSLRHAPGAAVDVELRYADDTLRLRVRDNGPGPPATLESGGHGLLGMRERAAAVGGELRTAAAAGGGFLVEATLPAKPEAAL
jgi:signal transduction histidine kinase